MTVSELPLKEGLTPSARVNWEAASLLADVFGGGADDAVIGLLLEHVRGPADVRLAANSGVKRSVGTPR